MGWRVLIEAGVDDNVCDVEGEDLMGTERRS